LGLSIKSFTGSVGSRDREQKEAKSKKEKGIKERVITRTVIQLCTCIESIGRAKLNVFFFHSHKNLIDNPEGANHSGKTQKGRHPPREKEINRLTGDVKLFNIFPHTDGSGVCGGSYHRIRVDAPEVVRMHYLETRMRTKESLID
jgi:hypothetical protein